MSSHPATSLVIFLFFAKLNFFHSAVDFVLPSIYFPPSENLQESRAGKSSNEKTTFAFSFLHQTGDSARIF
jgi:hypothetical protein